MLSKERLGRFTASRISELFVGPKGGSSTRDKYIFEKAEESVKGHAKQFQNKYTQHGHLNEFEAIQSFAEVTGFNVEHLNQEYFPINNNCGATPDAKVVDFSGKVLATCDVKCPTETFFTQKMMMLNESKPEFQNVPKQYYYQAQMQMLSMEVNEHYLVRYLTKMDVDFDGNKIEYNLPLDIRLYYKIIKADRKVQEEIIRLVETAVVERDMLIKIFTTPII